MHVSDNVCEDVEQIREFSAIAKSETIHKVLGVRQFLRKDI